MAPDFHAAAASLLANAQQLAANGSPSPATAANPGVSGTPPTPTAVAPTTPPANGPAQGVPSHVPYERVQELSHVNGQLRDQLAARDAELAALRASASAPPAPTDPAALAAAALRQVQEMRQEQAIAAALNGGTVDQRNAVQATMTRFPGMSAPEAVAFARMSVPQAFQAMPPAPPAVQAPGFTAPPPAQAERDRALMADHTANPFEREAAINRNFRGLAESLVSKARALQG